MKATLKRELQRAGLYEDASSGWIWLSPRLNRVWRGLSAYDARYTSRYLASQPQARLHIGCGGNHLAGWLNTDLAPKRGEIHLDATRPFPFADATFAFVYSEHMIEHVSWEDGGVMLRECHRVLKPGGALRIVTPDLAFLVRLLTERDPQLDRYIAYSFDAYRLSGPPGSAVAVVNNFVRAWGHRFIYDEDTLRRQFAAAGFDRASLCRLHESRHAELAGLAMTGRMPENYLEMESLVLEAEKPGA